MAKITETKTTRKEVEREEQIEYVQCDVCDDKWEEGSNEMVIHDFAVDPSYKKRVFRFNDLEDIIDSHHVSQPRSHGIEQFKDGKFIQVPHESLAHCIRQEIKLMYKGHITSMNQLAGYRHSQMDNDVVYEWQDELHHFAYKLNAEATSKIHKHVCDDCFEVVFGGD